MDKMIHNTVRLAIALIILTISVIFCLTLANAFILPKLPEASHHLAQVNWYAIRVASHEIVTMTCLAMIVIYVFAIIFAKKTKPSQSSES